MSSALANIKALVSGGLFTFAGDANHSMGAQCIDSDEVIEAIRSATSCEELGFIVLRGGASFAVAVTVVEGRVRIEGVC